LTPPPPRLRTNGYIASEVLRLPQHDIHHDAVKHALVADGWTITHDPLTLTVGLHNLYVDLGAQRMLAAERGDERIAVEIKSFLGRSEVSDFHLAVGQYLVYLRLPADQEPERTLYLAVPTGAYNGIFSTALGQVATEGYRVKLIVYNVNREVIERWNP